MTNQSSASGDKAALAAGLVNRPSDGPESRHPLAEYSAMDNTAAGSSDTQSHNPPPYSGPTTSSQHQRGVMSGPQYYPGLPVLDYRQYMPPLFELSSDKTTIASKASYLSENAAALASLIRGLATVPPKPHILVQGRRGHKVDFAVKMNLMSLLAPDDPSRRMDYLRCVNSDEMAYRGGQHPALKPDLGPGAGLEDWCGRFVKDPAIVKTFTIERTVANLDTNWIEGQLRSLVASTDYRGIVTVQFPVTHSKVIIQNPDKMNKFLTSVTSLFSGKNRYEVVKVVWPFATSRSGESGRQFVVQSEKTWWAEWKDIIRFAIATKRQGWVTNEDKLQYIMEGIGKENLTVDWGTEY
ncbi:hypothetical protein DL763_005365 [Monosporascus cannonballus]|nr:hypothetical protein DL763_005365 [Monosporascus cannonballus]